MFLKYLYLPILYLQSLYENHTSNIKQRWQWEEIHLIEGVYTEHA